MQPTGILENSKATKNPLKELLTYGQSMWLDYIRRDLFTSGELKHLIDDDGLRGMTSNPAIFEKAIADSTLYDDHLEARWPRAPTSTPPAATNSSPSATFRTPPTSCAPSTTQSNFRDGYVSLEVSPYLARNTQETIDEARRLWKAVNRENVMIKVPGTAEGIPAIRQLHQRRHQHQHHAALRAGSLREGRRGLRRRRRRPRRARRRSQARWPASPASSSAASTR